MTSIKHKHWREAIEASRLIGQAACRKAMIGRWVEATKAALAVTNREAGK